MEQVIKTGLMNFYGEVEFYRGTDGKYYISLQDWNSTKEIQISQEFFKAAAKEFSNE